MSIRRTITLYDVLLQATLPPGRYFRVKEMELQNYYAHLRILTFGLAL
jgi:hypothetical protein